MVIISKVVRTFVPTNKHTTMILTTSLRHFKELKAKGVSVQLVTSDQIN
jgi:hypothetical protein